MILLNMFTRLLGDTYDTEMMKEFKYKQVHSNDYGKDTDIEMQ